MNCRISDSQVFTASAGNAFQALDDAPALGFSRGDWLIAKPSSTYAGDCMYILRSSEVVRLQGIGGCLMLVRGNGSAEEISTLEATEIVAGRVVKILRDKAS